VPISGETGIMDIKDLVVQNKFISAKKKGNMSQKDMLKKYIADSLKHVDIKKLKPLKVVVDAGNSMGSIIAKELFSKLNCRLIPLYFELDGNFPNHHPDPLKEENLRELKKIVLAEKADLGIAPDGDADRIFFVDETGATIPGDITTALVSSPLLERHPGAKILYDLRSSWSVKEEIIRLGGIPVMSKVGHSLIKPQMRQEDAIFAGEVSGHYFAKDAGFIEAPIIVILYVLEMISKKGNLSELVKPIKKYFNSGEINSDVEDKEKKMTEIEKKFSDAVKIYRLDGLSVEYKDWWFNLRPSNTENVLRLNLEAKTKETMEKKRDLLLQMIRKK
jgi:phosphomannomutase